MSAAMAMPMMTTQVAAAPMTVMAGQNYSYAAPVAAPAAYAATTATIAAPASYAAPVTYAAAPASYAAPTTTVAAPVVTTMAAPMAVTTQAPSYVAAPQAIAMPQTVAMPQAVAMPGIVPPAAPMQPPKLTTGIPTPEQIQQQKAGYSQALDKQLKDAIETVQKETKIEKEMVQFNAEKNIALYNMQVDEKLAESIALEDERAVIAQLELKKALVERNLQLSNQANNLTMDWNLKALQTEWAQKRFAFDQQYMKQENALAADYQKQAIIANAAF